MIEVEKEKKIRVKILLRALFRGVYFKIIALLVVISLISVLLWSLSWQYRGVLGDFFNFTQKKENTTAHVLGAFAKVSELYVYRENRASLFNYVDPNDESKSLSAIIRYSITVKFDTKQIKIVSQNTKENIYAGYKVTVPKPIIEGFPNLGAGEIGDSLKSDTLGIEIVESKGDFKLSDDDKLAEEFIKNKIEEERGDIEKRAFETTKEKIIKFCSSAGINILEVVMN